MQNTTTTPPPEHQTVRIWKRTLAALRLVAALRGERMVVVLDRLVGEELARLEAARARERKTEHDAR